MSVTFGRRLQQQQPETLQASLPLAGAAHKTKSMNFNCVSGGTWTCTNTSRGASHTSLMHIPRAHKAAWALKLPLYIVFILFEYTHVTLFTNLIPHTVPILWVVKQVFKICMEKKASSGSDFTFKTTGEVHEAVGLFCFHMQVFEPTYLSTMHLPHIYIFVTTDTPCS